MSTNKITPEETPQFTPGDWIKWRLSPDSDPQERVIVTTADGETEICGIVENEADADLIIAAPNLYTFLQKIYLDYEDDCRCEHDNENCCAVVGGRCAKCHAFVALLLVDAPKETK